MALSNWDTLAFNSDGQAATGEVENKEGKLEIYKNWAYIVDPKLVTEESFGVVCSINSGDLACFGFNVYAKRGPQNAIFLVAETEGYPDHKFFGGIGCYGYKGNEHLLIELGRDPSDADDWCHFGDGEKETLVRIGDGDIQEQLDITHLDTSVFLGVLPETLKEFFEWAETLAEEFNEKYLEWLEKCKQAEPLRHNQGDKYFADNLDIGGIPSTEIGKAQPTVMTQMMEDLK